MLVGSGFDIHRLESNRRLIIGGIHVEFDKGLVGHSDGDVLLHALCDAILGAAALGDIGDHFPDTDPGYKGISSEVLLEEVLAKIAEQRLRVHNADCTVIAEKPKLGPLKKEMRARIAELLGLPVSSVNVKAKTMEGLGPVGAGEAIAAQAVVSLEELR